MGVALPQHHGGTRDESTTRILNGAFKHCCLRLGRSINGVGQEAAHGKAELIDPDRIWADGNYHWH